MKIPEETIGLKERHELLTRETTILNKVKYIAHEEYIFYINTRSLLL